MIALRKTAWIAGLSAVNLVCVAMTATAFAAGPTPPTGPTAAPTGPTGPVKKGSPDAVPRISLRVSNTFRFRGRSYVLPTARVRVRGEVTGNFDGQTLTLRLTKGGRTVKTDHVRLTTRGGKSTFSSRLRIGKRGKYIVKTELPPTLDGLVTTARPRSVNVVKTSIHRGSKGIAVRVFQSRLASLGYVVPRNGNFDAATGRAFMAYRKVSGMARKESASSRIATRLAAGKGKYHLRHPKAGRHIEVSIRRQIMVFADKGEVQRIYHVSTGAPSTPTVRGTYRVYRKDHGTNAKGMVHSSYFIRGYAIHGFSSVPTYNASHGCVRVPVPNAQSIFDWVRMGTRVDVYF